MRVAVVFDNSVRPETTGLYCRRALGQLVEVEHLLPNDLDWIRSSDFDGFIFVDDGLDYDIPTGLGPTVWWAIDTHLAFEQSLRKAQQATHTFAAQKNGAAALRDAGIDSAAWLPLACDPAVHARHTVSKQFDFSFVGHLVTKERQSLLARLEGVFPESFIGQRYFEEMAIAYSASRSVVNQSVRDDVNMRVFEALSCGSMLLTNAIEGNGLEELCEPELELATFGCAEEAEDRLRFYLEHGDVRQRIADRGHARVRSDHTYKHRMAQILRTLDAAPVSVAAGTPFPKPIETRLKDAAYFEHARPDVLELVPREARRVLDVGCGAGRLGLEIQRRQPAKVTGLERDPVAAEIARSRLSEVLNVDVEADAAAIEAGSFDCVILADVLEHLRHPQTVLRNVRRWLSDSGTVVASIPNLRHHSALGSLLSGNFTYEAAGLLDEDHVRFFTRREIEKLFFRAGFEIERLAMVPGPGDTDHEQRVREGRVSLGRIELVGLSEDDASEFYAYQYLLAARPRPIRDFGLTSIIIPTHNQLGLTKECLDSIRMRTDESIEIIVADNGSTDGTVEYLRALADVRLIENAENLGFPAAVNQGLRASRGDNLLLLNNDTVVTTGWLHRLLEALHSSDGIGLVGPVSNNVSGEQQIPVDYTNLADLDGFAWDLAARKCGNAVPTDRLVGFCMLFERRVLNDIGLFDEQFGIGCFEDDDFCRRALGAGYQAIIVQDAFVHHFGSQTFRATGVDFTALMNRNQRLYDEKWSDKPPAPATPGPREAKEAICAAFELTAAPGGGLLLVPTAPKISLCMIVRDNESTIGPCLASIRPWVDEIIVVDTGSIDRTPEICREYGARMFEFPWCDDFSAARNESVRHAKGEWIFWMDSDDTIPEEQGHKLRELAYGPHAEETFGYIVQVHCPAPSDDGTQWTVVDHVKLFRNLPALRFEHRIHEQIIPAIRRAGGEVSFTDLHVVHSGSDHSPQTRARKLERDYRILELDLAERPDHPFVLFNLGMTYADDDKYDKAVEYLNRCLEVSSPRESHVRKAYALLTSSLVGLDDPDRAEQACERGLSHYPDDRELLFRRAMLHHDRGDLEQAASVYEHVLRPATERNFQSIDPGITGHKARHNLAIVYEAQGRLDEAQRVWIEIVEERPEYVAAWMQLGTILCAAKRAEDLRNLAARAKQLGAPRSIDVCLLARAWEAEGRFEESRRTLEAFLHQGVDSLCLNELCRLLFERISAAEAAPWLQKLLSLQPEDAQTLHNLGTSLIVSGRFEEAVSPLQRSVQLRSDSPGCWVQLARALHETGRSAEAVLACGRALEADPEFAEAVKLRSAIETSPAQ